MKELLPYYALFYVLGILMMSLFARIYLYNKRKKQNKRK